MKVEPRITRRYQRMLRALRFRALSWRGNVNLLVGGDGSPERDLTPLATDLIKLAQDSGIIPTGQPRRRVKALVRRMLDWADSANTVKQMPKWTHDS